MNEAGNIQFPQIGEVSPIGPGIGHRPGDCEADPNENDAVRPACEPAATSWAPSATDSGTIDV